MMRRLLTPLNTAMMLSESSIDIELINHFLVQSKLSLQFHPKLTRGLEVVKVWVDICNFADIWEVLHCPLPTLIAWQSHIETVLTSSLQSNPSQKTGPDYFPAEADSWLLVKQGKFSFWETGDAGPTKCCSVFVLICSELCRGQKWMSSSRDH